MFTKRAPPLLMLLLLSCCVATLVGADTLNITCSQRPVDVQYRPVNVTCNLLILTPAGANAYQVSASNGDYTVNPINGYLYYDTANITKVNVTLIFMLEQNAPNGTYSIYSYVVGYSTNINIYYRTTFVVANTVNDNSPPTLTSIYAPPVNISNPGAAYVQIVANDDFSKFDSIGVDISNTKSGWSGFGKAQYVAAPLFPAPLSFVQNGTSVIITLQINIYNTDIMPGIYYMQVTLCDIFRHCAVFTPDQLEQRKLQSELNVGPTSIRDSISFVCPQTIFDAQYRDINVVCQFRLQFASGINQYWMHAEQFQGDDILRLLGPDNYFTTNRSVVSIGVDAVFLLRRYQPAGNYSVSVNAYAYSGAYLKADATISVAKSINDEIGPTVTYIYIPNVDNTVTSVPATLNVTDDRGGVDRIYVGITPNPCYGECSTYAQVEWNAPANSTRSTNLRITLDLQANAPIPAGVYDIHVYANDVFGRSYSPGTPSGLQSYIIVGYANNSVPTPKLTSLYVPPVVKDRSELFVRLSASDPNGLLSIMVTAYRPNILIGSNTRNITQTSVQDLELRIQIPSGTPSGTYYIDVIITGKSGTSSKYTYADLTQSGFTANFTYVKSPCAAGRYKLYSAPSSQACSLCPIGTYSEAGEFRCHACAPGYFSTVNGTSACQPCPAGTTGIGGSWACSDCPIGWYNSDPGQVACKPCAPGHVSYGGNWWCYVCLPGTYTVRGKSDCFACPAGTYSSEASDYCMTCPPGTYANKAGSSQCTPCPAGTYASGGFTSCAACESGKTGPEGSNSKLNCYVQ